MGVWRHLLQKTQVFGCVEQEKSRYLILGIPLDQTTTYKPGTRFAPNAIRNAACNLEFYSMFSDRSLDHIGFIDLGDLVVSPGDLFKAFENIDMVIRGIREEYDDKYLFILGGEHTITYPIIGSLRENIDHIIVFDAHLDLRDEYLGSRYNHATVMRRIIEDYKIPITYFGVRAFSIEEIDYLRGSDLITLYSIKDLDRNTSLKLSGGNVYISIDADVLDPSYAPGVSNPEPLGLDCFQLIELLYKVLRHSGKIIGVDLVEVNPLMDINDVTSLTTAKIILEIIGFLENRTRSP
ncbi:MAG: agmatinase [Desulfurococcales archaeon ex4484_58]|nr:MAG: agmatinase [Desulfurococcales archaeon ex4484_58]